MGKEARWDMVLAARLLQWGAKGSLVAAAVGCTHPEISRAKEKLLRMAVEPMTDAEAEAILGRAAAKPEESEAETSDAAVVEEKPLEVELPGETEQFHPQPEKAEAPEAPEMICVEIKVGRNRAYLEAVDPKSMDKLIAMLAVMTE